MATNGTKLTGLQEHTALGNDDRFYIVPPGETKGKQGKLSTLYTWLKGQFDSLYGATEFNGARAVTRNITGLVGVTPGGVTVTEFLNKVFYPSLAPTLSVSISNTIAEKGTTFVPVITGTITVNNGVIVERRIKTGSTLLNNPSGNTINYTAPGITANTTYTIEVDYTLDGVAGMLSQTLNVAFYAPTFYGVGDSTPTEAEVEALTKNIWAFANRSNLNFNPTNQRYWFAEPSSYAVRASIKDQNNFEVIDGFNITSATFTLADGTTTEGYRIYVSNANTTQTNFKLSFLQ